MEERQVSPRGALTLNGFQIKLIALVIMTIDHLAAFEAFPMSNELYSNMRLIGRIAAPLFLFMNVEALHHTHNRAGFLLRLYLMGVALGLVNALSARLFPGTAAADMGNMFPTFLYVGIFAWSLEALGKHQNFGKCALGLCGLVLPFACSALDAWLYQQGRTDLMPWTRALLPSPTAADYSLVFIFLGVAWYLIDNRRINMLVFLGVSLMSLLIPYQVFFSEPFTSIPLLHPDVCYIYHMFTPSQWGMVFALPLMLCYNGERGRNMKYLFYIYYPVHQYIIAFIGMLWQ